MIGAKLKRTNWGEGTARERIAKAVLDWDAKTGAHFEENKDLSLTQYAMLLGIPLSTLAEYCRSDLSQRKALGVSAGKQPLFNEEQQKFVVDVIVRHDRGNDGLNKRQCIDKLHDMRPDLKRKNVSDAFDRTVRSRHTHELTGIIKANATTVKRTAITVPQQFRWHTTIDQALDFLRLKNTCRSGGTLSPLLKGRTSG